MSAKKMRGAIADECSGGSVFAFLIRLQQPESLSLPADDIRACFDALVADVDRRADDRLAQVMLAVTAEGSSGAAAARSVPVRRQGQAWTDC
jgi:hypothetical protein